MTKKQKKNLFRIILTVVLLILTNLVSKAVCGMYSESFPYSKYAVFSLYMISYFIIGYDILRKSAKGILKGQFLDENFLMVVATAGAIVLAVYEKKCDLNEAVAVMLFYQTGELFENIAVGKSRKNIASLMDIRPDYANIEIDGQLTRVNPSEIQPGSIIIVQPGEKVPLDGIIEEGFSTLNTSAITGESIPVEVTAGDRIVSGSICLTSVLKIRTTKLFEQSTVSKILKLVEESSSRKSKSENFIAKFAKIYTPSVCGSALALAVLPPAIRIIAGYEPLWSVWIYRALTFLVISCPCALVISIPLSFFAGLGRASHEGILIKGSNYLETLSKIKTIVFDKTGTLTKGVFEVCAVHHNKMEEEKIIEYAALAECASSHPISKSLQNAYGKSIDRNRVQNIEETAGLGVTAAIDGVQVACGNSKLMQKLGITYSECHCTGTIIHIAINGEYSGHIVISDVIKLNSAFAIAELKKAGIKKTVMLTGDTEKVAADTAAKLGIDKTHSDLLPHEKVSIVEKLIAECGSHEKLAFVGDGINDAPVLSRADIGISMGAMGSDAAIEAADIVLMDDDPYKIVRSIKISRKCIGIVYQNIIFAFTVKFACLLLGAFGIANMWLAIFADVGVMIIAVLNAIRLLIKSSEKQNL